MISQILYQKFSKYLILLFLLNVFAYAQKDIVNGNLIQFNDNGLWCWFQDERCVVDETQGKIILGFDESQSGLGGTPRNGIVRAVIYDILTGTTERYDLRKSGCDDHNAPGLIIRPDGKYLAMYSDHYDYYNRYRIFDGNTWSAEHSYDWRARPGGTDYTIAYNNIYYLSDEGRMYDFSRANHRSPNFIVSEDMGNTWTWGGQLTTNTSNSYNKGYYKYWGNGKDRIDFIFTEQHPRDTLTSIYHGYLKGGKLYRSDDFLVDDNIWDTTLIPAYWNFTKVFSNGTTIGDKTLYRCWQSDLVRYDDGTIAVIITARTNQYISNGYPDDQVNPHHDFIYCRYDGINWSYTYLAKAGLKFYSSEADYVGLGALSPNDPNTLYISTPYDPRDTTINLGVREIFKGVTSDNGVTWSWIPITQNSTRDNIRPIVPAWNENNTVLLWCRGTYISAQSFDAAVVGMLDYKNVQHIPMAYVDANLVNTTLSNDNALVTTGPDANAGADDNQWHQRTGFGNNGSVFTSSETGNGEDAPILKTKINVPQVIGTIGTYDVWVNFWANPTADWRIKAGLSESKMQIFRSMASKSVANGAHDTNLVLTGSGNTFLYQAYLGRVQVDANGTFEVFIDDHSIQTGTQSATIGDIARTWYDGISYSSADAYVPVELASFIATLSGSTVGLEWSTKSELNNYGFEIERQIIADKITYSWHSIGFVSGKGTTTNPNYYSFEDKNINPSASVIRYRLKQVNFDGSFNNSPIAEVHIRNLHISFNLNQNYPNPFNPSTTISFSLPKDGNVELKIYNSIGEEETTLLISFLPAGYHEVKWNAQNMPAGIYLYKITAGNLTQARKMALMK